MFPRAFKITLLFVLLSALVLPNFSLIAQNDCQTREECEALLEKYEEEIKELEGAIGKTEQEQRTIQSQINILRSTIQKLELQIQQGNITIRDLTLQIKDTESSIEETSLKIRESSENLIHVLRKTYEEDQKSIVEIFLKEDNLSDFFNNLVALEALSVKNKELLGNIKGLKAYLQSQKEALDGEKINLEKVVQIQYAQKQQSQTVRQEQEYFLTLKKAEQEQYLKEKEEAERVAAEIRERLFRLIGIPDIQAPTFGEAIEIANAVTRVVNVRPAFLLGVISAESALGRNVGTCFITNENTGEGRFLGSGAGYRQPNGQLYTGGGSIERIIRSTVRQNQTQSDLSIFLKMTGENFSQIPVSCWIPICYQVGAPTFRLIYNNISIDGAGKIACPTGYAPYGFGGAMGPAQFIPSTWALYEGKIRDLFGISAPSPWNVRDAFAASALYLYELGAGQKTLAAERNAANRYSGGYSWYAGDVMQRASCIQEFIDKGTMSLDCQKLILPVN